jgi:hypothetical protein
MVMELFRHLMPERLPQAERLSVRFCDRLLSWEVGVRSGIVGRAKEYFAVLADRIKGMATFPAATRKSSPWPTA